LVEKAMQLSFRRDDRHALSKRNPLLLKPGVSPALMLWMPQNSSPYGSAFSNEPIAEVRSWKLAALVTAVFVCGTTFLGMLHIVRQFANPAKVENAELATDSTRPQITNLLPSAHHISAPAARKRHESSDRMWWQFTRRLTYLLPSVAEVRPAPPLEDAYQFADAGRRQFRPGLPILPVGKHEPGLAAKVEGAGESHDRARRQVTLRLLPSVAEVRPAPPLEDAYQFADAERRQFRPKLSILRLSKRGPDLVAKGEGARESHDRARRQVTLRLPPNLISEHDWMFTGTISDLKPSSIAADTPNILSSIPDFHPSGAPSWQPPSRRYPAPIAHSHWQSSPRYSSTEEATTAVNATETDSGANKSEALIAHKQALTGPVPKPERKPKRSSRAKKVSSKKAVGQCWNRIWRC
jgi:hypothetical protein